MRRLNDDFMANSTHAGGAVDLLQKLFEAVSRSWCSGLYDIAGIGIMDAVPRDALSGCRTDSSRTCAAAEMSLQSLRADRSPQPSRQALELAPLSAIEFVWLSRNGSFSEFLFSGERFSMHSFNSIPHLDDRRLLTYR